LNIHRTNRYTAWWDPAWKELLKINDGRLYAGREQEPPWSEARREMEIGYPHGCAGYATPRMGNHRSLAIAAGSAGLSCESKSQSR